MVGQCMSTARTPRCWARSANSVVVPHVAVPRTIQKTMLLLMITAATVTWMLWRRWVTQSYKMNIYILFTVSFEQKWIYFIKVLRGKQIEVVYGTFHVDVGETPFFISVDFTKRVIVITIRGTLSMKDIITDLNAECELIPLQNINHDWKGHKVGQNNQNNIRSRQAFIHSRFMLWTTHWGIDVESSEQSLNWEISFQYLFSI